MTANEYKYVDLGLPSGTLWATCNVGANKPIDAGLFFAWGETVGHRFGERIFQNDTYKFIDDCFLGTFKKYNARDYKNQLDLEDDAAHANMGGDWRMPTVGEIQELIGSTIFKCVGGSVAFISRVNGNKVRFPLGGFLVGDKINYVNRYSYIWSKSLEYRNLNPRYGFFGEGCSIAGAYRCLGFNVRGVINVKKGD